MTKKIYVDEFVCLLFISTEGTYHLQFGKCARFPIFPYRRKYYHLFTQKVLSAHIRKEYMFLVNIWNHGKNLQDLRGQNHFKNVGLV